MKPKPRSVDAVVAELAGTLPGRVHPTFIKLCPSGRIRIRDHLGNTAWGRL